MTLKTCQLHLKAAEASGDKPLAALWQERIDRKLNYPKYAHLRIDKPVLKEPVKEVKKNGTKSKR